MLFLTIFYFLKSLRYLIKLKKEKTQNGHLEKYGKGICQRNPNKQYQVAE